MYIVKEIIYNRGIRNGGRTMDKKTKYDLNYAKANIKRIPLDVQKAHYEEIKEAAEQAGMKVNSFIKEAIAEKIERQRERS
jgi:glycosylphosphatidylinositol transamidase (GPIT) subunit GPI8